VAAGLAASVVSHQLCLYAMRTEKKVMQKTIEVYYDSAKARAAEKKEQKKEQDGGAVPVPAPAVVPAGAAESKARPWYRPW
jgi:coenzyme F420-reducing hydrogenase beta subunit